MITISKLYPKGCRGVLDGPALRIHKGGLLLCGSNGTGKSSYIDALEKIITGVCGSLDTGDQGLSWGKQGAHVKSKSAPEIELTIQNGSTEVVVSLASEKETLPKHVKEWFAAGCKQSFLLRRRSMLRFIDAKPADRYKAVEAFLNLREFAALEGMLRAVLDELESEVAVGRAESANLESLVRRHLSLAAAPQLSNDVCLEAASQIFAAGGLSAAGSDMEVEERAKEADSELAAFGDVERLTRQRALVQACQDLPGAESIVLAANGLQEALANRDATARSIVGSFHSDVLEGALAWLSADALDQCPVCESTIDRAHVQERIRIRLEDNAQFTKAQGNVLKSRKTVIGALQLWLNPAHTIRSTWKTVLGEDPPSELEQLVVKLDAIATTLRDGPPHAHLGALADEIAGLSLPSVREHLTSLAQSRVVAIPDQNRYQLLIAAKAAAHAYLSHWRARRDLGAKATARERSLREAKKVVALAEQARKRTVQDIMDGVADLANEYYQKIHPDEQIGAPKLKVTDRGTGSLQLEGGFHGLREDPRGRYSEGHIDSLGLCLFLAIRRLHHRQDSTFSLLVLDDVLHSVDGAHRRETAHLIFDEFSDHQIIVTTHDPLWFENLKRASTRKGKQFAHYRFSGWSLSSGPILGDHKSDFEWLVSPAASTSTAADRVIRAGRLLEDLLQNACDSLVVHVPFRIRGDYTIDPLWSGFRSRAKSNLGFWQAAEATIESVETLRHQRNWVGAHWNEWAQQLTEVEADSFTKGVLKLRALVFCSECDRFAARIAQLDGVWACKGEHLRYDHKTASSSTASAPTAIH